MADLIEKKFEVNKKYGEDRTRFWLVGFFVLEVRACNFLQLKMNI